MTAVNLVTNGSAVSATSYATASFTPPTNSLVFASFASRTAITTDPTQPTCTGCNMTWNLVNTVVYDNTSSSRKRLTLFCALSSNPQAGALTFDEAGQTQTHAEWIIDQITGSNLTNGGLGAVIQSVTNFDGSATIASITGTLNTFSNPNNVTYGVLAEGNGGVWTAGTGFTQVAQNVTSTAIAIMSEFAQANVTAVAGTDNVNSEVGVIGVEVSFGRSLLFVQNNVRPRLFSPGNAR